MKLVHVLAIGVLALITGCVANQAPVSTAPPVTFEDGTPAVEAPRGLTLGAPLRSQAYFDRFTLYNGDLKIGYHLGTTKKMGMNNLKVINGNLNLELDTVTYRLFFPKLEKVTGNIVVTCPPFSSFAPAVNMLETLDFSSLKEVGGNIVFQGIPEYNGAKVNKNRSALDKALIQISDAGFDIAAFGNLERVGGNILFEHNAAFSAIRMPVLETVGGRLSVTSSPRLTYLDLRSLKKVGDEIRISNNEALESTDLSVLMEVASMDVTDNNFVNDRPMDLKMNSSLRASASNL